MARNEICSLETMIFHLKNWATIRDVEHEVRLSMRSIYYSDWRFPVVILETLSLQALIELEDEIPVRGGRAAIHGFNSHLAACCRINRYVYVPLETGAALFHPDAQGEAELPMYLREAGMQLPLFIPSKKVFASACSRIAQASNGGIGDVLLQRETC